MKRKIPSAVISLLVGMLVPLIFMIITSLRWLSYQDGGVGIFFQQIPFFLLPIFILAGLPSLLLSAIANYFLMKSGASDRAIMFASITIGIVVGIIAVVPVGMTGVQ
jgi:hypothetical protein